MASTSAEPDPRIRDLYAVPPADFVAARDALARALAAERSPAAAEVKRLRRPPLAAWLLNAVARRRPEVVARIFAAGDRLRRAQAAADGEALRASGAELREAVAAGVAAARELAAGEGRGAASLLDEVERALRAAATTELAARPALEGAVLDRPPRAGGADLLGGSVTARPTPAARRAQPASRAKRPAQARSAREAERERREGERAARAEEVRRERERRRTLAEVERAEQAVRAAEDRARAAAREVEDARRRLAAARDAARSSRTDRDA